MDVLLFIISAIAVVVALFAAHQSYAAFIESPAATFSGSNQKKKDKNGDR